MQFVYISVVNWAKFVVGLLSSIPRPEIRIVLSNALISGVFAIVWNACEVVENRRIYDLDIDKAGWRNCSCQHTLSGREQSVSAMVNK